MGLIRNIRKGFMFLRPAPGLQPEDMALLSRYLNPVERDLFLAMDEPDQHHSLRVARICAQSLANHPHVADVPLMKAALLHDIGKTGAHLRLWFRTWWVTGHRLLPWVLDWIARRSANARPGTTRHRMYVQYYHARIGVDMLRAAGVDEGVCRLVLCTAERRFTGDSLEKKIIMGADADRVIGPEG
jgi:putative nucleotidyltransferase with HDIG domain